MNVSDYDNSMVTKIKDVFSNTVYANTDIAFEESARINGDKPKVPLVSLWRTSWKLDSVNYNEKSLRSGRYTKTDMESLRSKDLRSLPIEINYQMDVWGTKRTSVDQLVKELIFFFYRSPNLLVIFNEQKSDIQFSNSDSWVEVEPDFDEGTDPSSFQDKGPIFRTTIELILKNAMLFEILEDIPHVGSVNITVALSDL